MCREVLPRLQGGRDGLKMAKVVGLEGVVVTSTDRGSRFDHFRNTARIRHRKPLAPVCTNEQQLKFTLRHQN